MPSDKVSTFSLAAAQCQYERKYRRSAQKASDQELEEFAFHEEESIPPASPVASPVSKSRTQSLNSAEPTAMAKGDERASSRQPTDSADTGNETTAVLPSASQQPEAREVLAKESAELHLFDVQSGTFIQQDAAVTATVSEIGDWQYWLQISGKDKECL